MEMRLPLWLHPVPPLMYGGTATPNGVGTLAPPRTSPDMRRFQPDSPAPAYCRFKGTVEAA
jgi:hypothetical protein